MTSLRTRIALVFVGSTALVLCLATAAAMVVTNRIGSEAQAQTLAAQFRYVVGLAEAGGADRALFLSPKPEGQRLESQTTLASEILHRLGIEREVTVTWPPSMVQPTTWIRLADGNWLAFPTPSEPPPPEAWLILSGWMTLILLGTTGVSFALAQRVTRPLALLEHYASSVGPNGEMASVPEIGPVEVRTTARALNRLSAGLRQAMESRMRLVAAAGHDLRTPLTRMRLRAEFLDAEEREKWLKNIYELERIADSAIQLVREEHEQPYKEPVQLEILLQEIVSELETIGHNVDLIQTAPAIIQSGRLSLKRAISNLIQNAAIHGGGATIILSRNKDSIIIDIVDDGPGIPEDLLHRVFDPFFSVDHARRKSAPGAGLGLAIADEIIRRAGGKITISNRQEGGLCQRVFIPCGVKQP